MEPGVALVVVVRQLQLVLAEARLWSYERPGDVERSVLQMEMAERVSRLLCSRFCRSTFTANTRLTSALDTRFWARPHLLSRAYGVPRLGGRSGLRDLSGGGLRGPTRREFRRCGARSSRGVCRDGRRGTRRLARRAHSFLARCRRGSKVSLGRVLSACRARGGAPAEARGASAFGIRRSRTDPSIVYVARRGASARIVRSGERFEVGSRRHSNSRCSSARS